MRGQRFSLIIPALGLQRNIMLAVVLAKGETIIRNAAKEPEIADLQGFLNSMGARYTAPGIMLSG